MKQNSPKIHFGTLVMAIIHDFVRLPYTLYRSIPLLPSGGPIHYPQFTQNPSPRLRSLPPVTKAFPACSYNAVNSLCDEEAREAEQEQPGSDFGDGQRPALKGSKC